MIEKHGSWFSFGSEQLGQGREQTKQAIKDDKELEERLLAAVREKVGDKLGIIDEAPPDATPEAATLKPVPQEAEAAAS